MTARVRLLFTALTAFAVLMAGSARAEFSKLSPRVRIAAEQLKAGANPRDMVREYGAAVNVAGDLDVFITGNVSRADLEAAGAIVRTELPNGIFTAFIPESAVDAVAALPGVRSIEGAVQCEPNVSVSVPTTMADIQRTAGPAFTGASGAGVIIGDIDTGVSFRHDDFKDAGGSTRILNIWDQTDAVGPNPAGFAYGSEWTSADINANLPRQTDTNGHGTHCLGIAAGDGSGTGGAIPAFTYTGMAPKADIIAIKSSLSNTTIIDGTNYFFQKCAAAGKPGVLNMSFGSQFGPHDGTDPFETSISSFLGAGKVICISAGNDGGTAKHAGVNVAAPSTPVTLSVTGTGVGRIAAVDGYYNATEAMNVTVSHPTYGSFGPITLGNINAAYPGVDFGTGATKGKLYIENGAFLTVAGAREVYLEIRGGTTAGSTMNGTWTITFTPTAPPGAANGRVDLWRYYVSNTALVADFVTGRENARLVSQPGTAIGPITVAAWCSRVTWTDCGGRSVSFVGSPPAGALAAFSSNGPSRDGRTKPDIAAPGTPIGAARSLDASGTCPASASLLLNDGQMHVINSGTSMAAPHVVGAVALLMQKFGPLTPAQALAKLTALALVDANTGAVPNTNWGVGKLRVDVTDPTVLVSYPNGGETLYLGSAQTLTWNATDPIWSGVVNCDIELSRNNGGSWETIAIGAPNTGSFNWVTAGALTTQALLRVKAHDVADNIGADVSNAVFEIADVPVPVGLALFLAEPTDNGVKLSWKFTNDSDYSAVRVERGTVAQGPFTNLNVAVNTVEGVSSIVDDGAIAGTNYFYRLAATSRRGDVTTFGPLGTVAGRPITDFALAPVWPNPTHALAQVDFSVPRDSHVTLRVFDIQGRAVATLADKEYSTGRYQATWDGKAEDGAAVTNGVYFVHMLANGGQKLVQRVTLAR